MKNKGRFISLDEHVRSIICHYNETSRYKDGFLCIRSASKQYDLAWLFGR
jgi:hypothetical protein